MLSRGIIIQIAHEKKAFPHHRLVDTGRGRRSVDSGCHLHYQREWLRSMEINELSRAQPSST
jgi:hypothetical protein